MVQDESCIAAHLGERAAKVADDEAAALEQQNDTEHIIEADVSVDGTGADPSSIPHCMPRQPS